MKVSFQWLKEFVEIDLSPKELAYKLTHAGLEVESVHSCGKISDEVIVVQIEKIEKHPQADRLSLCDVNMGTEVRTIVCGAKNMRVGDKVSLAQPGVLLPDGKKIERSTIRGMVSEGMLCSEVELGLFEESTGLMILSPELQVGKALSSQMNLEDSILEINVTPNRADCLSIYGLAREVAAILGKSIKPITVQLPPATFSLEGKLSVEVKDEELCPRYTARMIEGVKISPSPFEVRLRLHRMGLRSINNVVDATNYVMLELGQPLHAFDYTKIKGEQILIRRATEGEKTKTLDELERSLQSNDLLICDKEQILAIAGVMGAASSGVNENTQTLVLESAYFKSQGIRKTSRRLGLQTESSYRFERGVDPNSVVLALNRLADLIVQWAGGKLSKELIDTHQKEFPNHIVSLRLSRIHQVLGVDWKIDEISRILSVLQLKPQLAQEVWQCSVPAYRQDLTREIDLIEEVARLVGYDKISPRLPSASFYLAKDYFESSLEENLRLFLSGQGFTEVIHYSFGSEKEFKKVELDTSRLINLANPLSEDLSVMRPSLLPSMLACLQRNISRQSDDLKLYELRPIYQGSSSGKIVERKSLCLAWSGNRTGKTWNLPEASVDFYDAKGMVEKIWKYYKLPAYHLKLSSSSFLHPGMSAEIFLEDEKIGEMGCIHPQIAEAFDLKVPVVILTLDVTELNAVSSLEVKFGEIPRFSWVDRDLTVVAPENFESKKIIDEISSLNIPWIHEIKCIDVYQGEPIESGKKALTYSIIYLDVEKTLTDVEVNETHQRVMDHLKVKLPIEWR